MAAPGASSFKAFSNDELGAFAAGKPVDAIVIGSGVGGLTCASLIAQAGHKVLVLEGHPTPGGATQSFQEGQYQFEMGLQDVGAHVWLGESSPEGSARLMAAACKNRVEWIHLENPAIPQHCVLVGSKIQFDVHAPWAKQRDALVARFPDEAKAIDKFRQLVVSTRADAVDWMFMRIEGGEAKSKSGGLLRHFTPSSKHHAGALRFQHMAERTVDSVLDELTSNGELKYLLTYLWSKDGLPPKVASFGAFCLTAGQYADGVAFPRGGAGVIEASLSAVLEENGGKLLCSAKVKELVIEKGACVGVKMADGQVIRASRVISNAGAGNTFEFLIPADSQPLVKVPMQVMKDLKWSSYAVLQVFLGFNATAEALDLHETSYWFLPENMNHTENAVQYFLDSTFTQEFPYVLLTFPTAKLGERGGKGDVLATGVVFAAAHYDWFKGMEPDDVKSVADEIVGRLCNRVFEKFPQLKPSVKFVELITPLAHQFHLGANRGAPLGLAHTPERYKQSWLTPASPVPGLYLSGQDVYSAGVVGASTGGWMAAAAAFPDVESKYKDLFLSAAKKS